MSYGPIFLLIIAQIYVAFYILFLKKELPTAIEGLKRSLPLQQILCMFLSESDSTAPFKNFSIIEKNSISEGHQQNFNVYSGHKK
jgi:hypothetical protein